MKKTRSPCWRTSTNSPSSLPDGTLEVIPGVGHLIHYETPEPAARYIRRFLKDHAA